EYPDDKSWIIFNLRPEARYHDDTPITADDFVFAFSVMREYGRPFLKSFYEEIETVEALDEHRFKVNFKTRNNMKPLLKAAGIQPVPRHYWKDRDISKTYL
ncbi:MAG: ABC transporter substrate-binding protein, partial [Phycisphaerae bacterium]|nr:ABC transporter substrate-binding protein [Phycisphaerae bacterium]